MPNGDEIAIRLMGRFGVTVNGEPVEKELLKSRKGVQLLQLLILRGGEAVPNQEIFASVWGDEKSNNPESALKTMVSRFRTALAAHSETLAACVETDRGSYRFNNQLGISVDYYDLLRLCSTLQDITVLSDETLPLFEQLLSRYTSDLLPVSTEAFIVERRLSLHSTCFNLFYRYLNYLMDAGRYNDAIYTCRRLLETDSFDEQLQLTLMDALLRKGSVNDARLQHQHVTESYYRYLGTQPPDSIRDFYNRIASADKTLEESLNAICSDLRAGDRAVGAFICDYAIFRNMYSLLVRSMGRTELKVFVMLITLQGADGTLPDSLSLNSMMERLQEILRMSLRRGDVVSRFSASKFALLLPMALRESAVIVMDRVKKNFYSEYGRSDIVLNYRISSIERVDLQEE